MKGSICILGPPTAHNFRVSLHNTRLQNQTIQSRYLEYSGTLRQIKFILHLVQILLFHLLPLSERSCDGPLKHSWSTGIHITSKKILIQQLWQQHVGWDTVLNTNLQDKWHMISTNITQATSLPFPRKYNAVLAGSIMAALTKSLAKMDKFFWANFVLIVSNQNFCACVFSCTRIIIRSFGTSYELKEWAFSLMRCKSLCWTYTEACGSLTM